MEQESRTPERREPVFSMKLRAGRKRTYFFDVRPTRSNDFYLTITESKKRYNEDGYERHKIFIYKEDFNRFIDYLTQTVGHVKTELMPDYDFDEFNRRYEERKASLEAGEVKFNESLDTSKPVENSSSSPENPVSETSEATTKAKTDEISKKVEATSEPEKIEVDPSGNDEEKPPVSDDEDLKW
ncbi:MAG: DUF3276 family protein [Bacteroidetes bacterium]|nr:DUF3276 family protein [Bacteroidota bacterium]